MDFVDVRDPVTKKLLFRYAPAENVITVKAKNGTPRTFYLNALQEYYANNPLSTPEYLPPSTAEYREP